MTGANGAEQPVVNRLIQPMASKRNDEASGNAIQVSRDATYIWPANVIVMQRCQKCQRLLDKDDPIYRVTTGYSSSYPDRWHCSVGSLCAKCASAFDDQRWRRPERCRNCGRPVILSRRRKKPTHVVCGEKCRNAVYYLTSARYRAYAQRKEPACETCGRKFNARRTTARYCSTACRQSAFQARRCAAGSKPLEASR